MVLVRDVTNVTQNPNINFLNGLILNLNFSFYLHQATEIYNL